MRSTFAVATLIGSVLTIGPLPGAARAERTAPIELRANPARAAVTVRMSPITAGRVRSCGTADASPSEAEGVRSTLQRWLHENAAGPGGGTIRIAFHVISSRGEGNVTDAQIAEQVRELNQAYEGTGYRFELASVDRTENAGWFRMSPGSGKEKQAKQALAIDPVRRLNLYTCAPGQDLTGWASYPWSAPESDVIHGVVLDHASLPGSTAPVRVGRTAAHEVGHYLGLIHEHMELTNDAGHARFTPGQQDRMRAIVPVYRPSLFSEPFARAVAKPEIAPGAGAEPEEGRVLAYRGAFPNPFRNETAIRWTLPASAEVSLRVYSVTGQLARMLVEAQLPPGDHSAMFRAGDLPSGAYFAVLTVGRVQMSRTLVLIR